MAKTETISGLRAGTAGAASPAGQSHLVAARDSPRHRHLKAEPAADPAYARAVRHGVAPSGRRPLSHQHRRTRTAQARSLRPGCGSGCAGSRSALPESIVAVGSVRACRRPHGTAGNQPVANALFQSSELHDPRRSAGELADDRCGPRLSGFLSGAGAGRNYPDCSASRISPRIGWRAIQSRSTRSSPRHVREVTARAIPPSSAAFIARPTGRRACGHRRPACSIARVCTARSTFFGSGPP